MRLVISFILLLNLSSGLRAQTDPKNFKAIVDSVFTKHPERLGILVHVEAPDQHDFWSYAIGNDGNIVEYNQGGILGTDVTYSQKRM